MKGEEFKAWLLRGAPLDSDRPKPTPTLDPKAIEALKPTRSFGAEHLADFELPENAGDDVIATMTPNGLEIEVVERAPVGMRQKDRRRALKKFKISREKLANMTKAEAERFFVSKLQEMGVREEMARKLVGTRLTFADMPKSPIRGRSATTVIVDDPLKPLSLTSIQVTSEGGAKGKVTVDAQTTQGLKRVEFTEKELRGDTLDGIRRKTLEKLNEKTQESVKKWFEDNDGMKPYPTSDGKTVEPEGQRILGIDWGNGGDKTAVAAFRKRSDGTVVLEDFRTLE